MNHWNHRDFLKVKLMATNKKMLSYIMYELTFKSIMKQCIKDVKETA